MTLKFKILPLATILLLFSTFLKAQNFYHPDTIQEIRLTFAQSNWDALLDAAEPTDTYIVAQSISLNGTVLNNVGVKFKGNSSYNANYAKNPFHIELDTYQPQDYQGITDIKLNNVIFDPTFVREAVSYNIVRKYMHAPLSNYAKLYINNSYIGLYTNVESISKKFVSNHFGSKTNAFFNCSPPAGASPQSTSLPNLSYQGTNASSYTAAYEMKSDSGWNEFIAMTYALSNNVSTIENVLDVDRALWMLALDNVMVNLDSYIGQFKQNYYLYKDDFGRFNPIMWDLNMSFGVFGMTGSGGSLTTTTKKNLTHTLHATESNWPLVQKLLAVPSYKKKYLAHYKTILNENFANNNYYATAQAFQTLISAAVTADVNKFYTTAQFTSNMTTDVNVGNNTAPGLNNLMPGRVTYLNALSDFTATQPTIASITPSVVNPVLGAAITMTATVTNTNTNAVYLGYRTNPLAPFVKVTMYDDGAHNDGAAGDNVYAASMPINAIATQYYIYAENNTIGRFSPERAEHEFYTLTATYATINKGDVTINELLAQNVSGTTDSAGDYEDWVELYNTTNTDLDLGGYYLSDNPGNLTKWQFPLNTIIPSNGYLIVWADDEAAEGRLHATWKLSVGGESVVLTSPSLDTLDRITFGAQSADTAFARVPNGTGNFVKQAPTFSANNEVIVVTNDTFTVTTAPSAVAAGITSGGGRYVQNTSCTANAIPNVGYSFANWSENGNLVATSSTYTFQVVRDINLVANFVLTSSLINKGDVRINELVAQNVAGEVDEAGDFEDWVELFNTTNAAIDLSGYYLSDDVANLSKWKFPTSTVIAANGYLIVWADDEATEGPLHATWKLSSGGEAVVLSSPI